MEWSVLAVLDNHFGRRSFVRAALHFESLQVCAVTKILLHLAQLPKIGARIRIESVEIILGDDNNIE